MTFKDPNIVLVIGGTRSGKSSIALNMAETRDRPNKVFIATAIPFDDEMQQRIEKHQSERNDTWQTIEAPYRLAQSIALHGTADTVLLVDCITVWLNNLLLESGASDMTALSAKLQQLIDAVQQTPATVFIVSNEVGCGIVPENRLARVFRDLAGWANRELAACADQVVWTVAGIPVTVKGSP
jgi:adenosylcobinamide kinase/adenosylcobinamide-phosphate guanylyltransferase